MAFPLTAMRALVIAVCVLTLAPCALAQNWKQVHKADEAKWAKTTGLDPWTIHKLWHDSSNLPGGKEDDESRIANIDVEGLAERHDVLFVTYAGEKNCLKATVFRQFSESKYLKAWWVDQLPEGGGFCDTAFGSAEAEARNGAVAIRVPSSLDNGKTTYTVYVYEWNGITYHLAGQKKIQSE